MRIRLASPEDGDDIRDVYTSAFPAEEAPMVANLALSLLGEETRPETFSLVAEVDGAVVGHIAFSPVSAAAEPRWTGYILAPLAVESGHQGEGIGSGLVNDGLARLSAWGVDAVLVYGDPGYYGRFGFSADTASGFLPPHKLQYPFGWQARLFDRGHVPASDVEITCVAPLNDPALW